MVSRPDAATTGPLGRAVGLVRSAFERVQAGWRRLRAWRRVYFTRGGALFAIGAFAVGFAAMNTGNNLLFLLLGAMLGTIALSGWLSEQAIRSLRIRRLTSRGVPVQSPARVTYEVTNEKSRLPTLSVEIVEQGLHERAYLSRVGPGETVTVGCEHRFVQRGVYPLSTLTLTTSFPFGLFRKERDLEIPGELVIWPRTDRPVRPVSAGGGRTRYRGKVEAGRAGARGEYRGLRGYRPGDDPRDIHWRSTARLGEPVIREYEEDSAETVWICLDTRPGPGEAVQERAVEVAASLAARFRRQGEGFGMAIGPRRVDAGSGAGQLERALDALARVEFTDSAPAPSPPAAPPRCILVTAAGAGGGDFGDVLVVGGAGRPGDDGDGDR